MLGLGRRLVDPAFWVVRGIYEQSLVSVDMRVLLFRDLASFCMTNNDTYIPMTHPNQLSKTHLEHPRNHPKPTHPINHTTPPKPHGLITNMLMNHMPTHILTLPRTIITSQTSDALPSRPPPTQATSPATSTHTPFLQ